jgi:PLP dependent protein
MSEIADNLARVQDQIAGAARRAGRKPEEIQLISVSKTVPVERIQEAIHAGIKIFGENYIQEAQKKIETIGHGVAWHFIGHLQTNKAKFAVRLFDLIHSVDSLNLAQELNRLAQQQGKVLPILLQVSLSGEETKFGAEENEILTMAEKISAMDSIIVQGLMTMPPFFDNPEESRPYFASLRKLAENLAAQKIPRSGMKELSMGMSNDFEVAIEEGATMVRVGTAIFGLRPKK